MVAGSPPQAPAPTPSPTPPRVLPDVGGRFLVAVLQADFLLLGLTVGGQGVLWADVVATLGIGKGAFGTAQLVLPLLAIVLLLRGGPLSARLGKQRLAVVSLVLIGAGNAGLALASESGLGALVLALAVTGAGFGLFEIAVNGAAMDWEGISGRSVLNPLHAGYSAGACAGAVGAGVLLGLGWRPDGIFLLTALCSIPLVAATVAVRFPPAGAVAPAPAPAPAAGAGGRGRRTGWRRALGPLTPLLPLLPLLPLAGAAALASVGESVANLWSVIYLAELGASTVLGGAAFALANAAMLAGRLTNARVVARLGPATSLHLSGAGLILAPAILFLPGLPWGEGDAGRVPLAVAGFGLMGLAVAGVVPTALTAGARLVPGNSGAVAGGLMTAVYLAFVVTPPLVGWLAEATSLRAALLVVALSGAGILALTRRPPAPPPPVPPASGA